MTDTTTRISNDTSGAQSTESATPTSVSDTGRVVIVASAPLVPEDTNDLVDVYVRDVVEGTLILVSVDEAGIALTTREATRGDINASGTIVTYQASNTPIVGIGGVHVFRRELDVPITLRFQRVLSSRRDGYAGAPHQG